MSFADNSFDYVFIAASLHHLPRPIVGLYELIRVAKYGVIVIELNDSWLTRLATRFKLATEIEETGNYVLVHGILNVSRGRCFTNATMSNSLRLIGLLKTSWSLSCLKV